MALTSPKACPCSDHRYADCCQPLHIGAARAQTAEALMRSRYSAYALGLEDHLWRSWHPRTRPTEVHVPEVIRWTGLEVVQTVDGGADDEHGIVEFRAHFEEGGRPDTLEERSSFERRGTRWLYVGPESG